MSTTAPFSPSHSQEDLSIDTILSSADPEVNSFECFRLTLARHAPSVIRKTFLKLSLKIHPDKNPNDVSRANEAFQKLSAAFEILYDVESQQKHLSEILEEKQQQQQQQREEQKQNQTDKTETTKKRPRPQNQQKDHWKEARKKKKKEKREAPQWAQRRWEDVVAEMKRREDLEKQFIRSKSDQRMERRIKGMIWRAMKICRSLDERAGCPPTFVNGLWAPLYEQETFQLYKSSMPSGWEYYWASTGDEQPAKRIYRNIETRQEQEEHPNPQIEQMLEKARKALAMNKYSFYDEPRKFLDEIIEYLRDDHEYHDMDDDLLELQQEEKERDVASASGSSSNNQHQQREYDF